MKTMKVLRRQSMPPMRCTCVLLFKIILNGDKDKLLPTRNTILKTTQALHSKL